MPLRPPQNLRILLIPDDDRSSREYTISRRMILLLILLLVTFVILLVLLVISYASLTRQARQLPGLQRELTVAKARIATVQELSQELEEMRSMQERLLVMLGVEAPSAANRDTLAGGYVPADGAVIEDDLNELEAAATLVMTPPPDLWPAAGFVTREFVEGDTPRGIRPHLGIDIAGQVNSSIRAAGKGKVLKARWDDFLGNFVEIQHGFGYVTVYGHCSRLAVRDGDRIDRGQVIGFLGGTGQASAPHLHFEVWKDGVAVDPRSVLPGNPPR